MSSLLNRGAVRGLQSELDVETAADIVRTFIGDSLELVKALRTSTSARDRDGVRLSAHALKSTAAVVGAEDLSQACAELETIARRRSGALETKVAEVVRLASATRSALRRAGYATPKKSR